MTILKSYTVYQKQKQSRTLTLRMLKNGVLLMLILLKHKFLYSFSSLEIITLLKILKITENTFSPSYITLLNRKLNIFKHLNGPNK